jgi:hypothetical protein
VNPTPVTVHVEVPPALAPHIIVRNLRRAAAGPLSEEFAQIGSVGGVFVLDYLVSTVPAPETDCDAFERQIPKRWEPKNA